MGRREEIGLRKGRGFTLIELLVVLLIMVIAYSLAAPRVFSGGTGTDLKAAARQLAAGLRKARNDAITQRREVAVTIDVDQRVFGIGDEPRVYRLPKQVDVDLFTAQSEMRNEQAGAIRFYPDGGSTGGRVTVSARGKEYMVDVNWLTGQVVILD